MSQPRTLNDVAKIARVSPSTVSRILNGSATVSPEKRVLVENAIAELGYRPNVLAQGLARGRSMIVGVVTQAISSPFYAETLAGIEQGFTDTQFHPMFISGYWRAESEREAIEILMARRVDGIITLGGNLEDAYLLELAQRVPVVAVGRTIPQLEHQCLTIDQIHGAYEAVQHLIGLGHRRIAHIAGPSTHRDSSERLAGYQQALTNFGLEFDADLVVEGNFQERSGLLAMEQLLARHTDITAVFAANDQMCFGARLALYRRGIRVPEDMSLIGFDDLFSAGFTTPPLTTIRQPGEEMGIGAAKMVLNLLEGHQLQIPTPVPSLIIRESTARLRR